MKFSDKHKNELATQFPVCANASREDIIEENKSEVGESCLPLVKGYPALNLKSLDRVPEATWLILYIFNYRLHSWVVLWLQIIESEDSPARMGEGFGVSPPSQTRKLS